MCFTVLSDVIMTGISPGRCIDCHINRYVVKLTVMLIVILWVVCCVLYCITLTDLLKNFF